MNTKERLDTNKQKMADFANQIQELENRKQAIIQELLRLDGENRLLMEMNGDPPTD